MLRLPKALLFPTLTRLKDVSFKSPSSLKTGLYKLDWTKIEEIKYNRWKDQFPSSSFPTYSEHALPDSTKVSYCGCLPEDLKEWVDNMQFALSEEYLQEIRHCSMKSAEEWDRKRPVAKHGVDPAIGPALSYVDTAFQLLSDCLFDPDTQYYSRSGTKTIAPFALSYRFWAYQTEFWHVIQWVNLPYFLQLLESLKIKDQETYLFGKTVYDSLQNHVKLLEHNHYYQRTEKVSVTEDDVLSNFLLNRIGEVSLQERQIQIPDIGKLRLLYPVKLRRAKKKITLTAEFTSQNMQKTFQKLTEHNQTFDFTIQGVSNASLCAKEAIVKSISSTPPPVITIEFQYFSPSSKFEISPSQRKDEKEPYEVKECRKIDMRKIERAIFNPTLTDAERAWIKLKDGEQPSARVE